MKILYVVPTIHDEGGVAKVLSIKTNVLIEKHGAQISILTFQNGATESFHPFHDSIVKMNVKPSGWKPFKILNYFKEVGSFLKTFQPDCIVICDFGWKGFFFSKFIATNIPIVFEIHGSLYNETRKIKNQVVVRLRALLRKKLLSSYTNIVYLSDESQKEWGISGTVIPNPVPKSSQTALLENPKAIAIARHSYEKGIDRLIAIWEKVSQQSNWILEIYGDGYLRDEHQKQIEQLGLQNYVKLYQPVKNIQQKYMEASILVMASRTEGYPMALLEAMELGLPVIAYDCPIGPRAIVQNDISGFLIEEGNQKEFVSKVVTLQNSKSTRERIGLRAKEEMQKLHPECIAAIWKDYLETLLLKK